MTDEDKRKEIVEHIKATYNHPDHVWEQRWLILQVQRATPSALTEMLHIVRSKTDAATPR